MFINCSFVKIFKKVSILFFENLNLSFLIKYLLLLYKSFASLSPQYTKYLYKCFILILSFNLLFNSKNNFGYLLINFGNNTIIACKNCSLLIIIFFFYSCEIFLLQLIILYLFHGNKLI